MQAFFCALEVSCRSELAMDVNDSAFMRAKRIAP